MTSLPGDGQRDRSQDCDLLGHREGPAHPAVAGHHAAPPLRLQGAAEPSPPLTEQCLAQPVVLSQ
jgi:hypothetical protein